MKPPGEPRLDLAALFEQHQRALLGLALRITGDFTLAEDALQEAFLGAHVGVDSFRGDARPSTWLYRIVVRESLGVREKASRAAVIERSTAARGAGRQDVRVPLESMEWDEAARELLRALESLPEEQRLALVLLSARELSAEEVANMLGLPVNTVYTRAFRARLKLREVLGGTKVEPTHAGS